jgi:hypothetical protein
MNRRDADKRKIGIDFVMEDMDSFFRRKVFDFSSEPRVYTRGFFLSYETVEPTRISMNGDLVLSAFSAPPRFSFLPFC